jgi:hypothetical protein
MPLIQTNLRLSDTNRPDVTTYLPPWNYLFGFTTSIRENSIGNTVEEPRMLTMVDVSGLDIRPGTLFLRSKQNE